jgi:exocyst complex component 4
MYLQEWFSLRIDDLAASLSTGGPAYILPQPEGSSHESSASAGQVALSPLAFVVPASESTITTLYSLARHFSDISELCILVLHLEVRMHCFHHLLAIAHGQNTDYHGVIDKMEPDENVTRLNKDLAAIEEAMQQSVQFRKFR